ncbi:MAG: HK97 family phage prohead protease [Cypionkella sp.]|uniref:HK97 family phage prohead protease n=1 Tax=Cypionkella sp. TaxID=2811411 RepID=UPI002730E10D|nr:HK97 family phage prohead protease [Cypionkella sp.]MDP2051111.1 HK97 family phage prohead protease [Cypionkella sp.]
MLWGGHTGGGLEVRRKPDGSVRLEGLFPYGEQAELSDGGRDGRPLVEIIEPGAFAYRIGFPDAKNIHLLHGHTFDKPLASVKERSLMLRDTPKGVEIAATISATILQAQYARDAVAQIESGLATGISPGFRIPPARVIPRNQAEVIEEGKVDPASGRHGAIIRRIRSALLYEFSIVTRPAYHGAQIEMRSWQPEAEAPPQRTAPHYLNRWRP